MPKSFFYFPESTSRIVIPVRMPLWKEKPSPGATVDWGHPISRNLHACWMLGDYGPNAIDLGPYSIKGTPDLISHFTPITSEWGMALDGGTGFNREIQLDTSKESLFNINGPVSFLVVGRRTATSSTNPAQCLFWTRSAPTAHIATAVLTSTLVSVGRNDGTNYHSLTASHPRGALDWYQIGYSDDNASPSNCRLYESGRQINSASGIAQINIGGSLGSFQLLSGYPGGSVSSVVLWQRALSAEEFQQLYVEPWCFLESPKSRTWFVFEGAAGPGGSVTLAGTIAAISTASGALRMAARLAGTAAASATATASLARAATLGGTAAATATASGALAREATLASTAAATASATGALQLATTLAGTAAATASATGALELQVALAGTAAAASTITGALSISSVTLLDETFNAVGYDDADWVEVGTPDANNYIDPDATAPAGSPAFIAGQVFYSKHTAPYSVFSQPYARNIFAGSAQNIGFLRCHLYAANSTGGARLVTLESPTIPLIGLYVDNGSLFFAYYENAAWVTGGMTVPITMGRWYLVEIRWDRVAGAFQVKLDRELVVDRVATIDQGITLVKLGQNTHSDYSTDVYFDNVAVATADWLGGPISHELGGTAAATASATGALQREATFGGAASASAAASGALELEVALAASPSAVATVTGALELAASLAGTAAATSTATGALNVQAPTLIDETFDSVGYDEAGWLEYKSEAASVINEDASPPPGSPAHITGEVLSITRAAGVAPNHAYSYIDFSGTNLDKVYFRCQFFATVGRNFAAVYFLTAGNSTRVYAFYNGTTGNLTVYGLVGAAWVPVGNLVARIGRWNLLEIGLDRVAASLEARLNRDQVISDTITTDDGVARLIVGARYGDDTLETITHYDQVAISTANWLGGPVELELAGNVTASASATGTLATAADRFLAGTISANSSASGALDREATIAGTISAIAQVAAQSVTVTRGLAATAGATAAAAAALAVDYVLSGAIVAQSGALGTLNERFTENTLDIWTVPRRPTAWTTPTRPRTWKLP